MSRGPRQRDQGGVIAVVVAVSALMMFAFAALVIDLGHVRDVRRQAQNAADASALAAGNELYLNATSMVPRIPEAVAAAKTYALNNYGVTQAQWAACTDSSKLAYTLPAGGTPCISFDQAVKPTVVRVKVPVKAVVTPLASLFGSNNTPVAARARATLKPDVKSPCALCVIGPGTHDLQNGDAIASGGDIHFNGSVSVSSNGLVATDGKITVQNTASGPLDNYTPDPITGQPAIPDPLAFVGLPPDISSLSVKTDPCIQGPGKYGSYNFPNALCTLTPGLYVIAGSGAQWALGGNSTSVLAGAGVTLYFTCGTPAVPVVCASGAGGATLDASGNGSITIQSPLTGPMQGLALVMDRNNTATLRLTGNGVSGMSGTIYLPSGKLQMNGNGCAQVDALVVIRELEMNGNPACLKSGYNPTHNIEFPPGNMFLSQ